MFNYGFSFFNESFSSHKREVYQKTGFYVFINSWHAWVNYLSILIRIWKSELLTEIVNFVNCQVWYKQKPRLNVWEVLISKVNGEKKILFTRESFDINQTILLNIFLNFSGCHLESILLLANKNLLTGQCS